MYSIYALPNIILPLFGGILIDKIGTRKSLVIFLLLQIFGQTLVWLSSIHLDFNLMLAGRFLFGLGGENIVVANYNMIAEWFSVKELGFATGIGVASSSLWSTINTFSTPKLYNIDNSLSLPLFIGLLITVFSFICGLIVFALDKYVETYDRKRKLNTESLLTVNNSKNNISCSDIKKLSLNYWLFTLLFTICYVDFYPFTNVINK